MLLKHVFVAEWIGSSKLTELTDHLAVCISNYVGKIALSIIVDVKCLQSHHLGNANMASESEKKRSVIELFP